MFSGVTMRASLMMCSHVATVRREPLAAPAADIRTPQYTHVLSRWRTSSSTEEGFARAIVLSLTGNQ